MQTYGWRCYTSGIDWAGRGVFDEDLLILKTAIFHIPACIGYDNHEYYSTDSRRFYWLLLYTIADWKVNELIMCTKLPRIKNKLEEVCAMYIIDFECSDMIPVSNALYMELQERNKIKSINDWTRMQIKFISNHQYFTETARNLREVNKQMQIERIRNLLPKEEEVFQK